MTSKIQIRRDTAANWTATNPTLAQGEPGLETDTRKVKYGTGSTAWNLLDYASGGSSGGGGDYSTGFTDGINDNTWHFVQIDGKKEFTYETEGYKAFEITLSDAMVADIGNGNLTFTSTETPQMAEVWLANNRGNQIYLYTKADYDSNNFSSFFSGMSSPSEGIYVFGNMPVPFAAGDKIVCKYWTNGTTYTGSNYDIYNMVIPDASSSGATNTIVFDTNEYPYAPWADFANVANISKQGIVFTYGGANDNRNVTDVVDNGNSTFTVTFDGPATQTYTTEETTFTYTAPINDGPWGCTIPLAAYPNFAEECHMGWNSTSTNKYTGGVSRSGWVIVNGGSPVDFYWYSNFDSENRPVINFANAQDIFQGDTVEIHFYKQLTSVTINFYHVNPNNWNNGHKWFDWKDDIATEYSPGVVNGVVSGRCRFMMKNYVVEDNSFGLLSGEMGWVGSGSSSRTPYDPYRQNYMSNWGDNANYNAYPFYRFDAFGIIFYSNYQRQGSFSQSMKVRVMYRFDLEIGEDDEVWYC